MNPYIPCSAIPVPVGFVSSVAVTMGFSRSSKDYQKFAVCGAVSTAPDPFMIITMCCLESTEGGAAAGTVVSRHLLEVPVPGPRSSGATGGKGLAHSVHVLVLR